MILLHTLERLKQINELIKTKSTGKPKEFSKKIGISESHLYRCINEIKEMGAPIKFCRKRDSYYYEKTFEIKVNYSIELVSEEESRKINAGFNLNNSSLLFYESGGL
ncbi:HTH domain-containing protein [Carboxylicivirga sp. M1479]|uniref:HTH domain-containing protein n=1 Tax=Carboxylicivirga sp. M1479 TaxID=2594476 RepID=UPI001177884B|nr:HTH domain-containing protein [Carboxylicivirga sp. M1479]TRX72454.1 HTH domain-containing protein [Carboxylicivirga sp. M1479]